mmetsp:Transcript_7646/g.19697  ORF Transcript_7646/g.19697 Transcript_7646/m.19697 type:complete len:212 (+) Transcript_7646:1494-2129(+)
MLRPGLLDTFLETAACSSNVCSLLSWRPKGGAATRAKCSAVSTSVFAGMTLGCELSSAGARASTSRHTSGTSPGSSGSCSTRSTAIFVVLFSRAIQVAPARTAPPFGSGNLLNRKYCLASTEVGGNTTSVIVFVTPPEALAGLAAAAESDLGSELRQLPMVSRKVAIARVNRYTQVSILLSTDKLARFPDYSYVPGCPCCSSNCNTQQSSI